MSAESFREHFLDELRKTADEARVYKTSTPWPIGPINNRGNPNTISALPLAEALSIALEPVLYYDDTIKAFFTPTSMPISPEPFDRFICLSSENGYLADYLYQWNGTAYIESLPDYGRIYWVEAESAHYFYTGAEWRLFEASAGNTDHRALTNLNSTGYWHLTATEYSVFQGLPDLIAGKETAGVAAGLIAAHEDQWDHDTFLTSMPAHNHDHATLNNVNSSAYYHLTQAIYNDLTDGGDSTLHYHSADRNRANHTGTQAISTITGLDVALSNKEDRFSNKTGEMLVLNGTGALDTADAWVRFGNGTYDWLIKYVGSTSGDDGNEFRIESTHSGKYIQFDHDGNFELFNGVAEPVHTIWHSGNLTPYTHPTFAALNPSLSGANVLASFTTNTNGHVTGITTRTLTLANLGYTGALNANYYVHPTTDGYLHVPATGSVNNGKFLMAGATAGSLQWRALSASDIPAHLLTTHSDWSSFFNQALRTTDSPTFAGATINGTMLQRSNNGDTPFYVTRSGPDLKESIGIWVDDTYGHIYRKNDEYTSRLRFTVHNTDTEASDGSRANSAYWEMLSSLNDYHFRVTRNGNTYQYYHTGDFDINNYCLLSDSRLTDAREITNGQTDWNLITANRANTMNTNSPDVSLNYMGINITHATNSNYRFQFAARNDDYAMRTMNAGTWCGWRNLYHTGNFNPGDYSLTTHNHDTRYARLNLYIAETIEQDRDVLASGIYAYNAASSTSNKPSGLNYGSAITWGRGANGSGQLLVGWTSGDQNWIGFRSLRDTTNNWWDWKRIYHTGYKPTPSDIGAATTSHAATHLRGGSDPLDVDQWLITQSDVYFSGADSGNNDDNKYYVNGAWIYPTISISRKRLIEYPNLFLLYPGATSGFENYLNVNVESSYTGIDSYKPLSISSSNGISLNGGASNYIDLYTKTRFNNFTYFTWSANFNAAAFFSSRVIKQPYTYTSSPPTTLPNSYPAIYFGSGSLDGNNHIIDTTGAQNGQEIVVADLLSPGTPAGLTVEGYVVPKQRCLMFRYSSSISKWMPIVSASPSGDYEY